MDGVDGATATVCGEAEEAVEDGALAKYRGSDGADESLVGESPATATPGRRALLGACALP